MRDGDGRFVLDGVRALQACDRAGVEVVIYSGRRQHTVFEDSRLLGLASYIFEVGCGLVIDGELEWLTDGIVPSHEGGTIFEQIDASGAPELLLEQNAGRLEYHTPWSRPRGLASVPRPRRSRLGARAARTGGTRLAADGRQRRHPCARQRADGGPAADTTRTTSSPPARRRLAASPATCRFAAIAPRTASRSATRARTWGPATVVDTFWLVANALERDLSLEPRSVREASDASGAYGAGVYEAVVTTLAERRAR